MKKAIFGIIAIAILFQSCASKSFVSIYQNGKAYSIGTSRLETLKLEKTNFQIRAVIRSYNEKTEEFYEIKGLAIENDEIFKKIDVGDAIDDASYFGAGRGMAIDPDVNALFVDENGFNNLYYDKENDKTSPMKLIKKFDDTYDVAGNIIGLIKNGNNRSIEQWNGKYLDLILFYDGNLNERIDKGELAKVKIEFAITN